MNLMYPVVFYRDVDGDQFSMFVPDFDNAMTTGIGMTDAVYSVSDLIACLAIHTLESGGNLPVPSKIEQISFEKVEEEMGEDIEYESKFKRDVVVNIDKFYKTYAGIGKMSEENAVYLMMRNGII